jgi:cation-transporting ATPase E
MEFRAVGHPACIGVMAHSRTNALGTNGVKAPELSDPRADHPAGGLTAAQVGERIARGEVNSPPPEGWAEYRAIAARNTLTLFNAMVAPAAAALFVLGDYNGAWAVSALAVLNTLIGLIQEIRAKRHLDKLALLAETKARVFRDGKRQSIPAGDVVLGDHVLVADGEPVVADGTVVSAAFLEIDEALLTGESDPVPRRPGDRLLSGSFCVAGSGVYLAVKVGGRSFAHETAAEARRYRYVPSPLQRTLDRIVSVMTAAAVTMCIGYVGLYFVRGFPVGDLVRMIAATVTSMVPQGLVLMATVAFVLGAVRVSRQGAVVQRLAAVESMAAIDTLCLDKTGTLTTGRLELDRILALDGQDEAARESLRQFATATLDQRNKSIQALRGGLGVTGQTDSQASVGHKPTVGRERLDVIDQLPFKDLNRYSAVRLGTGGQERVFALGAVEALAPFLTDPDRVRENWLKLLPTGLRLLAFGEGEPTGQPFTGSLHGHTLRPVAIVALRDEVRPGAGRVLEELAAGGIRVKVLSGDHPETIRAAVAHLRLLLATEAVVTGDELDATPDREAVILRAAVFGRVTPRQKLEIVSVLRRHGHHVGMIGDGVNDVLPIRHADLGIAMGAGTGAAKAVSGIVLETDDFALLPAVLAEGRTIVGNVRRAAKLFLLKNVYTLFLVVAALGVLGLIFPYLPQQVTLLNKLTIGGPALLIMAGRGRFPPGGWFVGEVLRFVLAAGLATGAAGLCVFLWSAASGDDEQTQRTVLVSALVLIGLGNVLLIGEGDRRLFAWVAFAVPAYLAIMYVGPTAHFFALTPLAPVQWAAAVVAAAVALPFCVLAGRIRT